MAAIDLDFRPGEVFALVGPNGAGKTTTTTTEMPSPRGLKVLAAVAPSLSNAEIGRELFLGEATTKTHLQRLFKLDVDDRTHPVTVAIERGLLPSPHNR